MAPPHYFVNNQWCQVTNNGKNHTRMMHMILPGKHCCSNVRDNSTEALANNFHSWTHFNWGTIHCISTGQPAYALYYAIYYKKSHMFSVKQQLQSKLFYGVPQQYTIFQTELVVTQCLTHTYEETLSLSMDPWRNCDEWFLHETLIMKSCFE